MRPFRAPALLILFAFLATCGCTPSPVTSALEVAEAAPGDNGRNLVQRACTVCHDLSGLGVYRDFWGRDEWRSMVETMVAYGAQLNPQEIELVADYLAVNFGTAGGPEEPAASTSQAQ